MTDQVKICLHRKKNPLKAVGMETDQKAIPRHHQQQELLIPPSPWVTNSEQQKFSHNLKLAGPVNGRQKVTLYRASCKADEIVLEVSK